MIVKLKKSKHGIALVTVIIVFAVISIMGTTMLSFSAYQAKQTNENVDYNGAYYLARSAVDIVAKDLHDKIDELSQLKSDIESYNNKSGTTDQFTTLNGLVTQYNNKKDFINSKIIGHTVNLLNTNGYAATVVSVDSKTVGGNNCIIVQSTVSKGAATATAKVDLVSQASTSEDIKFTTSTTSTTGKEVIYSWGNMDIGTNAHITNGGMLGYTGTYSSDTNDLPNQKVTTPYPINVMPPPSTTWTEAGPNTLKTIPNDGGTTNINGSGYYGDVVFTKKKTINVNTSAGSVTLVVNSISSNNNLTINVTGANKLYIYFVQSDTTNYLLDVNNDFNIVGTDTLGSPKTYFISYDKKMRNPSYTGSTTDIYIKNSATLDAFWYVPYTDVLIDNNSSINGSIFGGNVTINNNLTLNYEVPSDLNFPSNVVTTTTPVVNDVTLNYINFGNITKTWIR